MVHKKIRTVGLVFCYIFLFLFGKTFCVEKVVAPLVKYGAVVGVSAGAVYFIMKKKCRVNFNMGITEGKRLGIAELKEELKEELEKRINRLKGSSFNLSVEMNYDEEPFKALNEYENVAFEAGEKFCIKLQSCDFIKSVLKALLGLSSDEELPNGWDKQLQKKAKK